MFNLISIPSSTQQSAGILILIFCFYFFANFFCSGCEAGALLLYGMIAARKKIIDSINIISDFDEVKVELQSGVIHTTLVVIS